MAANTLEHVEAVAMVSTHSHPKVAAVYKFFISVSCNVSTHSHPKVAAFSRFTVT